MQLSQMFMHATGALAVLVMGIAVLVGVRWEFRRPIFGRAALLILATLSLAIFAVGQYADAVGETFFRQLAGIGF